MTPELVFTVATAAAALGWMTLLVAPWHAQAVAVASRALPLGLCAAYAVALVIGLPHAEGDFASLAGVRALFREPWALLAGWIHFLAFDLFLGGWIVRDAERQAVGRLAVRFALALTFLIGPVGVLTYAIISRQRLR